MELFTRTLASTEDTTALGIQPNVLKEKPPALLQPLTGAWDEPVFAALHRWSIPALRIALGLVFLWFGALKVFGVSPITPMLRETYTFLTLPAFIVLLGVWETLIGIGLVFKLALRCTLCLMCVHLAGTFLALWLAPSHFFLHGNPLVLTVNGEFVVKNFVLLAAGLVVGSYEPSPLTKRVVQARMNLSEKAVAHGRSQA
jgi:putative oxidoreductase